MITRFLVLLLTLALTLALAACGAPGGEKGGPARPGEQLFETTTTVLSSPAHGPMLCLGGILDSLPPQCGDVPITNWDWGDVEGEKRRAGTTWGRFRVIGTYDGDAFTVTDIERPGRNDSPIEDDPLGTPCAKPDDGWPVPDPNREDDDDVIAADAAVRHDPAYAGLWITYPLPATATATRSLTLLNVAFTGNLARHEAELRKHWGRPLCVVQFERSLTELKRIQKELSDLSGRGLDLQSLWSGIDVKGNRVEIGVVVLDDSTRKALDELYGKGTVRADPALRPVN